MNLCSTRSKYTATLEITVIASLHEHANAS